MCNRSRKTSLAIMETICCIASVTPPPPLSLSASITLTRTAYAKKKLCPENINSYKLTERKARRERSIELLKKKEILKSFTTKKILRKSEASFD